MREPSVILLPDRVLASAVPLNYSQGEAARAVFVVLIIPTRSGSYWLSQYIRLQSSRTRRHALGLISSLLKNISMAPLKSRATLRRIEVVTSQSRSNRLSQDKTAVRELEPVQAEHSES